MGRKEENFKKINNKEAVIKRKKYKWCLMQLKELL